MTKVLLLLCSLSLSHFSVHWKKTPSPYVHRVEAEEVQWREKGSAAAPARLAKTPIYGRPQKPCPNVVYSGWDWLPSGGATLHWEPSGLSHLSCKTSPPKQNEPAALPRPPVSRQEKDQSESRAVNPSPYTLTTGPKPPWLSTHSLLMEVIRRGSRTRANLKEANAESTQGWVYLCTAAGSVALKPTVTHRQLGSRSPSATWSTREVLVHHGWMDEWVFFTSESDGVQVTLSLKKIIGCNQIAIMNNSTNSHSFQHFTPVKKSITITL